MIIDLKKVTSEPQTYRFSLEKDWWFPGEDEDRIVSFDEPLEVKINLYRAGDRFVLEGRLAGALNVRCDRCLEPFRQVMDAAFRIFLARPLKETVATDVEIQDEDVDVEFIRDEEVELDGIIQEQIYLGLPIKCLCSEFCEGLCPECGGNLNNEECKCRREHQGHPAFAQLKNLRIKKIDHESKSFLMKKPT